jgi:Sel1 repeat
VYLGSVYEQGLGTAQDMAQAVKWYRAAADQRHNGALYNLGRMYRDGKGVSRDAAEALRLFREAAGRGQPDAQYTLGTMHARGEGVARSESEAARWFRDAAQGDNAKAMLEWAVALDKGRGVERDDAQAQQWYRKAEALKVDGAKAGLVAMYADGRATPREHAEGVQWARALAASARAGRKTRWAQQIRDLEQKLRGRPELSDELVPQIETLIVSDIIVNGAGNRLVVGDVAVSKSAPAIKVTLARAGRDADLVLQSTEFKGDVLSFGSVSDRGLSQSSPGDGTVYRFKGRVSSRVGRLVSYDSPDVKSERLTFALVHGLGFVYLRGNGTVSAKDGRQTRLGR